MTRNDEEVRISPRTGKPIDKRYSHVDHTKKAKRKYPNKAHNGKNSPVIGMNGYNLSPGDNNKITGVSVKLFNLPAIDLENPDDVAKRLEEYFMIFAEADMKPTVAGLAMALNAMSRTTLLAIVNDRAIGSDGYKSSLPKSVTSLIKKAYKIMENSWELYMNSGKLNPVTGIFLAKNNYGYRDQSEYVVTPKTGDTTEVNPEEIKSRYEIPLDNGKSLPEK